MDTVVEHLLSYGLETKPAEAIGEGAVLGLKVSRREDGKLMFCRANSIPEMPKEMTRRELFSVCGKLVGHYPIAGWLRIACSYIKRRAEGERWDDVVGPDATQLMAEVLSRVKKEDPVKGVWKVARGEEGTVWCDASSIGMGAMVEIAGEVVEDAAWLRKKDDYKHINVAELEAVLRGINLAIKWGLRRITVITDSATVCGWINLSLSEERRVKTKGAAEVLVKRRLAILKELTNEMDLTLTIKLVESQKNRADVLTRVKKQWIENERKPSEMTEQSVCAASVDLKENHAAHHLGVDRTLFIARKIDPTVSRDAVKRVVRECEACQSIDPAPVSHEVGNLWVDENWKRLAIDVTHYRQIPYLSVVDCGPGRFAIWRELRDETSEGIINKLEEIFYERGPVDELLMDNATSFKSQEMNAFMSKWQVSPCYRAAHRPSGNGIVERHHRTIKASAERGSMNPIEAVFWYNMSPRNALADSSVPQRAIYTYEWRHPQLPRKREEDTENVPIKVGEEVWVKPPKAKCTTKWKKGRVTRVNSSNNIEVDGMPRHVLDLRPIVAEAYAGETDVEESDVEGSGGEEEENGDSRYPLRLRREPQRFEDMGRRCSERTAENRVYYGE